MQFGGVWSIVLPMHVRASEEGTNDDDDDDYCSQRGLKRIVPVGILYVVLPVI